MSEYQYYEFLAIDEALDARQTRELRALSTRARITLMGFVNTYHWGDFEEDPRVLMERYFDAFLYLANWGTRLIMIRLPSSLLDLEMAGRYCRGDSACAWQAGDKVVVELTQGGRTTTGTRMTGRRSARSCRPAPSSRLATGAFCTSHGCSRWVPGRWQTTSWSLRCRRAWRA